MIRKKNILVKRKYIYSIYDHLFKKYSSFPYSVFNESTDISDLYYPSMIYDVKRL